MKRNYIFLFYLWFSTSFVFSQGNDCEQIISSLNEKERKTAQLNLHDPDYIPLHYLIAQDLIKELEKFKKEVISNYTECATLSFSELINRYDNLRNSVQHKHNLLEELNKKVYLIFYEQALYEYQFKNETDGDYFLQRSLQYNALFPDAILLKLNRLLGVNHFREALSLLNTLYYDTQMDNEQEKKAIVFTDKFYDKLYKAGDSLLKAEHAAEALELFEILEIFCQNLPTAYCNDDYYHGVLSSQSGIYDSYIAIAKVAEKRGNSKVAAQFYHYAQEYLAKYPHLKTYEPKQQEVSDERYAVSGMRYEVSGERYEVGGEDEPSFLPNNLSSSSIEDLKTIKNKYDSMVLQAFALCIKEDFSASYKIFLDAKKLEECRCFTPDFRVDIMLNELSKFELK